MEFIDKLNDLSVTIYNKIKSKPIECIEDLEIINQLIYSINNILKSDRYYISRNISFFVDYLVRYGSENVNRTYPYLIDGYYNNLDRSIKSIESVKKIIERM